MEVYDAVARDYAAVFDDIEKRIFEWPWIRKQVVRFRPRSVLDLGCGNGYLSRALEGMVPDLYALEPSPVMCSMARKNLGGAVLLRQGAAESMPFGDHSFDMVISLLSFRYMVWDRALDEIRRVLKNDGVFILVDLFAGSFNPLYLHKYAVSWAAARIQYTGNREYYKKLRILTGSENWRAMVREHPKRNMAGAKKAVAEKFHIKGVKILSAALRGSTAGFICGNRALTG
ncbi:MAG: class I SAM-dependent methyltransferase [Treponema sp.]|jgi:ubiquinone/menaquinone biosynthesis C-methylase UbiE|nr:class I SAM-dependent methyltransferase [Treponema sp.]